MRSQASFWLLVIAACALGAFFFKVVQPFLLPLLLAAIGAMLLRPFYEWTVRKLWKRRRLTAALFTAGVLLVVLLPMAWVLYLAGRELMNVGTEVAKGHWEQHPSVKQAKASVDQYVSQESWEEIKKSSVSSIQSMITAVSSRTQSLISNLVELIVGVVIMSLSLYYFLVEGPTLFRGLRDLSPLENTEEEILLREFTGVCRGVVLATLVCAFFQALAAGIGFAVAGVERVWLLSVLTIFTSMIPFVGAATVWLPVAIGLIWAGHVWAGVLLILYGSIVISSMDNFLRAYVIHDSAHLHPLVAIISVLGAIQVVGLWGIFLGPLVASIFYALLKILRNRNWDAQAPAPPPAEAPIC